MNVRPSDSDQVNPAVEIEHNAIEVDAIVVAQGMGLELPEVQRLMREGAITSTCERGIDDDAGRYRIAFLYKNRRLSLIVDETGQIIRRSILDYGPIEAPWRSRGRNVRM